MDYENKHAHEDISEKGGMEDLTNTSTTHDAVFGEISEDGPNYRDVGWMGTIVIMMKTQIGLGVLGIPSVLHTLGLIPGVIILVIVATMTTWSGWMVGRFKLLHPEVYNIDDAGFLMGGRIGREVLYWGFNISSAMLGISIGLNSLSTHGTCTAVFVAVAAIIGFGFGSIQTLGKVAWIAWVGVFGILSAVFTLAIAVAVQDRPEAAPQTGVYKSDYKLIGEPTFEEAMSAVCTMIFAFAGSPAFFSIASEMRDTRLYTRSLVISQAAVAAVYLVVGIIVYYFCGSYVASPALGSAGVLMKKVCYGLALPGLVASCMLFVHLPSKNFFMRFMRGTKHLTANTPTHWIAWLSCTGGVTLVGYILGSAIPVFSSLISLVGALFATFMSFQPMGCMYLYDNWNRPPSARTKRWYFGISWAFFIIIIGTFVMVAGTYSTILGIINDKGRTSPWSCADNSNSKAG
ncbi:probable neutral amino acid permease [Ramularia collo-cygni]|uniref:Probable neutral amino acid permease n=1 Tax=Ramularia collo-cygni TaxID=112498 RepID=A0A2D3VK94_9PEZI|nr:probable neutral amino acid permease [Ramularia collo-cygni]CZT21413.1 probable neutral amino acid permease [Ramularia collo-cygni]